MDAKVRRFKTPNFDVVKTPLPEDVSQRFSFYLQCTDPDLKLIKQNPNTPQLDLIVISIIEHARETGDHRRLDALLDRMIGAVEQNMNINSLQADHDLINRALALHKRKSDYASDSAPE